MKVNVLVWCAGEIAISILDILEENLKCDICCDINPVSSREDNFSETFQISL